MHLSFLQHKNVGPISLILSQFTHLTDSNTDISLMAKTALHIYSMVKSSFIQFMSQF